MAALLFDEPYYIEINEARWAMARPVIERLRSVLPGGLTTCADVGAGPGWFGQQLARLGLSVTGLEGRADLVAEAARRVPDASFQQVNVESAEEMGSLGPFDLTFCFGLLYHTENPFQVVRNLESLTRKVLFVETMMLPTDEPILRLVSEGMNETQGLTFHSIIPSRASLVKMLQTAGFAWVAEFTGRVDHPDFVDTAERFRRRGIFLAARLPLDVQDFRAYGKVAAPKYDFARTSRR